MPDPNSTTPTSATPSASLSASFEAPGAPASRVRPPSPSTTWGDALSEPRTTATTECDSHTPKPWFQPDQITWTYPHPNHPSTNDFPNTARTRTTPCTTCGAPAQAHCVTRNGNLLDGVHKHRGHPHGQERSSGTPWAEVRARLAAASSRGQDGTWDISHPIDGFPRKRLAIFGGPDCLVDLAEVDSAEDADFFAHAPADIAALLAEVDDLRSRLGCVLEATSMDRPYDTRLAAIRRMCDLTTNGFVPASTTSPTTEGA